MTRNSEPGNPEQDLDIDAQLADLAATYFDDPYGFVMAAFEWGKGELAGRDGPDVWQTEFLKQWGEQIRARGFDGIHAVPPIYDATTSGHGIGKSAEVAWIIYFIMVTRPHCKGTVTANSAPQLQSKTWAELAKWHRLSLWKRWFRLVSGRGSMRIYHLQHPETWFCTAQTWTKETPEAFAGQHAINSTSFYIFDEASAIPRVIFETAEGGLTDGEPMMFMFGNPTRNSGYFYEAFHKHKNRWTRRAVDSRTSAFTNKEKLQADIDKYGIDSDYVKVKIRGIFPSQSSAQFIPTADVQAARKKRASANITDPIIMGVDVARMGDDESVIRVRQGRDARTHAPIKLSKVSTMHTASVAWELAVRLRVNVIFVDETGVGGGVVDRLRDLALDSEILIVGVNFGGKSPDRTCHDMAAYMWLGMREWLAAGGAIDDDDDLESDLTTREYYFDANHRYVLESKDDLKARGEASPDDGDALGLTFAAPVGPRSLTSAGQASSRNDVGRGTDYDPND